MIRKIIHIDMDAFFASVEQRNNPSLRGKPVAVGGNGKRGVISAASYEARKYGVHSAMPTVTAKARCPNLILVSSGASEYREISKTIQSIFFEYTDAVEPLSLDEAFLDVTFHKKGSNSATLLATEIRKQIYKQTELTASAGISYNKFLAKIASDINKPNGQFVIPPEDALRFLENLKIDRFFGVGKVSADKFHKLGIFSGADLKKYSKEALKGWFGKAGEYYFNIVRGIDNRKVIPYRQRKSIGAEKTFSSDIVAYNELYEKLTQCIDRMHASVEKKKCEGKTLSLKIKYSDFEVITRSRTFSEYTANKELIAREAYGLFDKQWPLNKPVRLLGVSMSNFKGENDDAPTQMIMDF